VARRIHRLGRNGEFFIGFNDVAPTRTHCSRRVRILQISGCSLSPVPLPDRLWSSIFATLVLLTPLAARAQDEEENTEEKLTLSGTWNASGLSESWTTTEWGEACGPKPRSQGAGGGTVQISEIGGELSMAGAGRAFSTAECWEQMPGLSRTSHSQSGGGRFWRTRCATPSSDPRQATIVTTIQATDTTISMVESGKYRFAIKGQTCSASVSRSRSFTLVQRAGEKKDEPEPEASAAASSPPEAPPPAPTTGNCSDPGAPARLEVKPVRKLMRPGESHTWSTLVADAAGCHLGDKPAFRVLEGPLTEHVEVTAPGKLTIAEDAPEGTLEVRVEIEGAGVTVTVDVASDEHYDALLATRGFNEKGEVDESAVAIIATGTIGGRNSTAEDTAGARKQLFIAIVGGLAAILGLAGLILLRRGRKAGRPRAPSEPSPPPNVNLFDQPEEGQGMVCPACGVRYAAGTGFCAKDGTALAPSSTRSGTPKEEVSPADPAPRPAAPASQPPPPDKICPTCGKRYPGEAEFCGSDATALVPVN